MSSYVIAFMMQASEMIILVFINLFHFDGGSPAGFWAVTLLGLRDSDSRHSVTHCSGAFARTSSIITFICRIYFYFDPSAQCY